MCVPCQNGYVFAKDCWLVYMYDNNISRKVTNAFSMTYQKSLGAKIIKVL